MIIARETPEMAFKLMEKFFPGPLTLVLSKNPRVSDEVTAGLDSVAVRMPKNAVALALIRAVGTPIAAPSVNKLKRPRPNTDMLGLEKVNVELDSKGFIKIGNSIRTSNTVIYAAGDVFSKNVMLETCRRERV